MKTTNTTANTVEVNGQIEVVTVSSAMKKMKKTALVTTALAALGVAGWYGFKLYQQGKSVVDVVTETTGEAASEESAPAAEPAAAN
ncbi:hypothetical protein pEaSNUABM37_00270 [Erwinia phage pEa_SNUABM_37]|nr:hypothetical protein pEaSNUABM37_00270 [Erwinia phage pEa_SNUABM_37]QXO10738.1 hypothetical protein pEaSNUABM48_00270 [Erwinia phage pEa_SNUABM_48]